MDIIGQSDPSGAAHIGIKSARVQQANQALGVYSRKSDCLVLPESRFTENQQNRHVIGLKGGPQTIKEQAQHQIDCGFGHSMSGNRYMTILTDLIFFNYSGSNLVISRGNTCLVPSTW